MKKILGLFSLIIILGTTSCKQDNKYKQVAGDVEIKAEEAAQIDSITSENYLITVPHSAKMVDYLNLNIKPEEQLNSTIIQLHDSLNGYFVMVYEEDSKQTISVLQKTPDYKKALSTYDNFKYFFEKTRLHAIPNFKLMTQQETMIDSCKATIYSSYGQNIINPKNDPAVKVEPIYYRFAIIQSPDHFFEIYTWTPKEKESQNSPKMEQIIQSFELNNR